MNHKKLNVGCGTDSKPGWTNLDSATLPGVDIIHDIEKLPLPFQNEEFDEILCQDVLEHINYIPVLSDLYRILKKNCSITIRVPHFTSKFNFIDPTHKKLFSVNTFDFFVRDRAASARIARERAYYFNFAFERIASRRITFEKSSRLFFYNRIVEKLVNLSPQIQMLYESTGLARAFPAENIIVKLVK